MGFYLGPYFVTFITLVRRLFSTGSFEDSAAAPDGQMVSLRRLAGTRELSEVSCTTAEPREFSAWLSAPGAEPPRLYPPDLLLIPETPLVLFQPAIGVPVTVVVWFAPPAAADLATQLSEASVATGWSLSPGQPSPEGGHVGFALHHSQRARFILDFPIAEEPAVLVFEVLMPATPSESAA